MQEIKIRVALPDDAGVLLKIYEPYVLNTAISFEYDVPSEAEFRNRIIETLNKFPYLVAEYGSKIVGYAYAGKFHSRKAYSWGVETSIYVKENMRKMGIGRTLYSALEDELKAMGVLNMNACISYPEIEDEYLTKDSEKFHENMGFVKVAESHKCGFKFGRWYNIIWMEKIIGDHTANPLPVRSFSDVSK
ncbi:MAG: N-acetyltransferase family protein [Sedimentibacter sp.]